MTSNHARGGADDFDGINTEIADPGFVGLFFRLCIQQCFTLGDHDISCETQLLGLIL